MAKSHARVGGRLLGYRYRPSTIMMARSLAHFRRIPWFHAGMPAPAHPPPSLPHPHRTTARGALMVAAAGHGNLRGSAGDAADGITDDGGGPLHVVVSGYDSCGFFHRASRLVASLQLLYPGRVKHEEQNFPTRDEYKAWVVDHRTNYPEDPKAATHGSSPFVTINGRFLGGCDDTVAWAKRTFATSSGGPNPTPTATAAVPANVDAWDPGHAYDYDLVVIGGGSGGLACAKEAAALGARVALLDFVKPSPAGSSWGLGGTCVNVGCIPKKLFHTAALLGEAARHDLPAFGWKAGGGALGHDWPALREGIQNHIKSLNFGYRVALRDKGVDYLNKHGRFLGPHELEVVDKKGERGRVTAARFVVAVGGRPQPLACPGGELAITSDDVFSLEDAPGKTCVVGAGYVALECAGFLRALGHEVTVLVRSILLRGFDRECAGRIGSHLESQAGVKILTEVLPVAVEKESDGRLRVHFSTGESDLFDTVLSARGRYPDLTALNAAGIGLATDAASGKLICKHEQTSVPHVYAVGDVVHGAPELTPVAIQAGVLLARRLFGGAAEQMDYRHVATTVFTPLEYGCVGLSEEQAAEELGADGFEVYHSEFLPLEWALVHERQAGSAFCKVLVDKADDRVLGLHYCGPNAGEVIQGYAAAVKVGVKYAQLLGTVGIHPTCAEELVNVLPSKSSGASAAKAGC